MKSENSHPLTDKSRIVALRILFAFLFAFTTSAALAQMTVSNLDAARASFVVINTESNGGSYYTSAAQSFTTDASAYILSSVTVDWFLANPNTQPVTVSIYSDNAGQPGIQLETLTGDGTTSAGNEIYASGGLSLDANTNYYVIATVRQLGESGGEYFWATTNDTSETNTGGGHWSIGDQLKAYNQSNGSYNIAGGSGQLSITATVAAVPEPATAALLMGLVTLAGVVGYRKGRRARSGSDSA